MSLDPKQHVESADDKPPPRPRWAIIRWYQEPKYCFKKWRYDASKAKDPKDHAKFRRLKELALQAKNHQKALEFHVQEIRSRRGHGSKWYEDVAQFGYWATGDYGRSWFRPFCWMGIFITFFAWIYGWLGRNGVPFGGQVSWDALIYSASNMFSFFPVNRTARAQSECALFGDPANCDKAIDIPGSVIVLSGVETVIAIVLIFMLGLALRNQFRQ